MKAGPGIEKLRQEIRDSRRNLEVEMVALNLHIRCGTVIMGPCGNSTSMSTLC